MRKRSLRLALSVLALVPAAGAAAEGIDPAKACSKVGEGQPDRADPIGLIYMAIASGSQLQAGIFDTDFDGNETAGERLNGLFDPHYCAGAGKARCGKGDQEKLDIAQMNLRAFLDNHVDIVAIAQPSAEDIEHRPGLDDSEYGVYMRALDERKRFARLECKKREPKEAFPPSPHRWRVSNTVDGLSLKRGTPDLLGAVPQAEIAFLRDNEAGKETLDVSAVVGYDLSGNVATKLVPYLEVRHKRISGDGDSTDGDTKKWGAGFVFGRIFKSMDEISIAPHYAIDKATDAEFAVLKATWMPGFLYDYEKLPYDGARIYDNFSWKLDTRLLAEAGKVLEVGTSTLSEDDANYFRMGPWIAATVWLHPDNAFLSKFSLDAYYKNLVRIDGPGPLMRFSAGINYSPEKTDHLSFRLSYDRGREDDTLNRVEGWKLSFGVRY